MNHMNESHGMKGLHKNSKIINKLKYLIMNNNNKLNSSKHKHMLTSYSYI